MTTRRCCSPATAERWCPPTCWWRTSLPAGLVQPHDVGRKAIAQNAADIEAMGALPTAFVVAFGAPGDTPTSRRSSSTACVGEARRLGGGIVRGDLVSAPQWVISVTALGDLGGRQPVRPRRPVPATHWPSSANWAALQRVMLCGCNNIHDFEALRRRHLVPEVPYGQGRVAADGCYRDDRRLRWPGGRSRPRGAASGVGIDVSSAALRTDFDALAAPPPRAGPTPGPGCSVVARTMRWSRRFPGGPPPEGWRVVGRVLAGPPRVLVDGEIGREIQGGSRFDQRLRLG